MSKMCAICLLQAYKYCINAIYCIDAIYCNIVQHYSIVIHLPKICLLQKLELKGLPIYNNQGTIPTLTLTWPSLDQDPNHTVTQTLRLFDIVSCSLIPGKDIVHFEVGISKAS